MRPDSQKQSRNSFVYVFRGGNVATCDLFDIAGGTNGAWTAAILYGGSSTLFTTARQRRPTPTLVAARPRSSTPTAASATSGSM